MSFGTSAPFKNMTGHYFYQKKCKRDRLTGVVTDVVTDWSADNSANIATLVGQFYNWQTNPLDGTAYTGPFVAETIWICNGDTECQEVQILDGTQPLTCPIAVAPAVWCTLQIAVKLPNFWSSGLIYMPFFTAVNMLATSVNVRVTIGGWIP